MDAETTRQNKLLDLKYKIRQDESLLDQEEALKSFGLSAEDISELKNEEREFAALTRKAFKFEWDQFFYELFDFERSFFKYIRQRPTTYFLDKDLVEAFQVKEIYKEEDICPQCQSNNVSYDYAIDYKWDILYFILSILIITPFPLIRKKHHCFDCGFNYK